MERSRAMYIVVVVAAMGTAAVTAPVEKGPFRCLDLAAKCNAGLTLDSGGPASWAGYRPGRHMFLGVPFVLVDPLQSKGGVCARNTGIAVEPGIAHVFLLVGERGLKSRLELVYKTGVREVVDAANAVPVLRGPPPGDWAIELVAADVSEKPLRAIAWSNMSVFAATVFQGDARLVKPALAAIATRRKALAAQRASAARLCALAPIFQARSGRIAILPDPKARNAYASPFARALRAAGLLKHVVLLTPQQLVDDTAFNATRFWCAIYAGGERYWQTVARPGDGDAAIQRFLSAGGTLVLLSQEPFPFYSNQDGKAVVAAHRFSIPICGSRPRGGVPDGIEGVDISGWEAPPQAVSLTFHPQPNQQVVASIERPFPFPKPDEASQSWRPMVGKLPAGGHYTPALTLRDAAGKSYGEGVAAAELGKGRVVYVWSSLLKMPAVADKLLADVLAYALKAVTPPTGRYVCMRVDTPPRINGLLNDPAWSAAPSTEAFVPFNPLAAKAVNATTAKLCWDAQHLYVAFTAKDPDVWSTITKRDGHLWEGEVLEIYVDPDGDGRQYKEFEVNPLNAVIDLNIAREVNGRVEKPDEYAKWNAAGWATGVHVDGTTDKRDDTDEQWTAEMAIPWRNFATAKRSPPAVGDAWRVQLLRIDRSKTLAKPEFSAWSPTDTFHRPSRFGQVVFAAGARHDDFSLYPDGAMDAPTWSVQAGQWRIEDGALVGQGCLADGWAARGVVWGQPGWRDYTLRVRFKVEDRGKNWSDGPCVGVRCDDCGRGLFLSFTSRGVQLHRVRAAGDAGSKDALARSPWRLDSKWHALSITVKGPLFTATLDEKAPALIEVDNIGFAPAAGQIILAARQTMDGQRVTRVRFDDVKVELLY